MERDGYNGGDKKVELDVCCLVVISIEGHKKSKCLLYQQTSNITLYRYLNASQKKRITKKIARKYCIDKYRMLTTVGKYIAKFSNQLKVLYWI